MTLPGLLRATLQKTWSSYQLERYPLTTELIIQEISRLQGCARRAQLGACQRLCAARL